MLFMRSLKRNLIAPLAELGSVISALRRGNTLRRCTRMDMPSDIVQLFSEFNEFLDKNITPGTSPSQNERL
jgi:hypothetical protein